MTDRVAGFGGDRTGSAPLTWGQRAIWKTVEAMAPDDHWLNVRKLLQFAAHRAPTVDETVAAVGRLVTGHEALRTRVHPGPDGPVQVVGDTGSVPVEVVAVPDDGDAPPRRLIAINAAAYATPALADATDAMLDRLAGTAFQYAEQWPLRVGLLTVGGRVRHIVLVLCHVAVDWHAAELVVRDLRLALVRGTTPAPRGPRPLDLAAREGRSSRRTERAIAYWREAYRRLPAELFAQAAPAARPRYRETCLASPALAAAAAALAARHRVSTSTVLLAATAVAVATHTGHATCGLLIIVGNRYQPGHEHVVAPMNQLGLVVLDVDDARLGDPAGLSPLIPHAWQAALRAYRHAYYDQAALDAALAATGRGGGREVDPYACFNDVRGGGEPTAPAPAEAAPAEADKLRAMLPDSTVNQLAMDSFNWRFYLEVRDAPGALAVVLAADSRVLPVGAHERFLRDIEEYVVESACTPDGKVVQP